MTRHKLGFNSFSVFSKIYKYNKKFEKVYISTKGHHYHLMELVSREWYDKDEGLSAYLDADLKKKVNCITYWYENGMIQFLVNLKKDVYKEDKVLYYGKEMTLYNAICKYIIGQISDGWGGNGIYLLDGFIGDDVHHFWCEPKLYRYDIDATNALAIKLGVWKLDESERIYSPIIIDDEE